jgi:hypothetical protein
LVNQAIWIRGRRAQSLSFTPAPLTACGRPGCRQSDTIELRVIHAKSEIQDKLVFELTAVYDSNAEMLTCRQNIVLGAMKVPDTNPPRASDCHPRG